MSVAWQSLIRSRLRLSRLSAGLRLACVAAAVPVIAVGCAAPSATIKQTGPNADADTAVVLAKMDKVAERIVGVNKEVQQSLKGDNKATRDAIQTVNQGMGEWALLLVVASMRFFDVAESWVASRRGEQCKIPDELIEKRLRGTT